LSLPQKMHAKSQQKAREKPAEFMPALQGLAKSKQKLVAAAQKRAKTQKRASAAK
jgi:hypothetical protein